MRWLRSGQARASPAHAKPSTHSLFVTSVTLLWAGALPLLLASCALAGTARPRRLGARLRKSACAAMRAAAGRAAASVAQQLRAHAAEAVPLASRWVYAYSRGLPQGGWGLPAAGRHSQRTAHVLRKQCRRRADAGPQGFAPPALSPTRRGSTYCSARLHPLIAPPLPTLLAGPAARPARSSCTRWRSCRQPASSSCSG